VNLTISLVVIAMPLFSLTADRAVDLEKKLVLQASADAHGAQVGSEITPGPFNTKLVRAWIKDSYPGTGVYSAFVDEIGIAYGKRGSADFAEFVRKQGWLSTKPALADFIKLLDYAQYDAVLIVDHREKKPDLSCSGNVLVFRFRQGFFPSGTQKVMITIGSTGKALIAQE